LQWVNKWFALHKERGNMEEFKSGFVAIIGRTNVGKSTLINSLVGEKVAIMTNKPQTTRTAIRAIVNREHSQIIFIDTPGIHKPKTKLGNTMIETAFGSVGEVDVVLFLIEATSEEIGRGDKRILEKIKSANKKTILIINKIDLVKREKLLSIIEQYSKEYNFSAVIPISALKNDKTQEVLNEIEKLLKPGPAYYDIDEYTDQTMRQLAEETIREKALKLLDDEVPHGLYVQVEKMNLRHNKNEEEIYDIEATIYCLRNSHKGIIIGKNGTMLKRIGTYARQDLEKMLGTKVNLKTWVKVKEDWQDNDSIVKNFKFN
jgi:GTP-binding protein Era